MRQKNRVQSQCGAWKWGQDWDHIQEDNSSDTRKTYGEKKFQKGLSKNMAIMVQYNVWNGPKYVTSFLARKFKNTFSLFSVKQKSQLCEKNQTEILFYEESITPFKTLTTTENSNW